MLAVGTSATALEQLWWKSGTPCSIVDWLTSGLMTAGKRGLLRPLPTFLLLGIIGISLDS